MSFESLLSVLADGEFHSGDDLGEALGVSRTAVWKQLKKVEGLGLELQSIKGKGYCLPGGLNLLSVDKITLKLSEQTLGLISDLDVFGVINSTNVLAMAKAVTGGSGYVCTAEQQTAGRGRRGRRWVSPYASNLYLSVVWEFAGGAASLEGLSLAVGVAVVDALTKAGVVGSQLKWPNDVLYGGRKLSGILLEMVGDAAGPCQVVIGIGLNVSMPAGAGSLIDQSWVDVGSILDAQVDRSELLALLLNELMPLLASFEQKSFAAYHQRWQNLNAYAGQEVFVKLGDSIVVGESVGVDSSGAVIINTGSGRQLFSGGEISLRVKNPGVTE
jgi:BirA family transcriptional regulator, biotin operon repressor / biotin---[acetyl-CoA-carboxylase] ligase